jgi:hypothetical protein
MVIWEDKIIVNLLAAKDAEIARLKAALRKIAAIENEQFGHDWEEIDKARDIANAALANTASSGDGE